VSDEPPPDDAALFRAAMRGVRRLTPRARPTSATSAGGAGVPGASSTAARRPPPPRARFARGAGSEPAIDTLPPGNADFEVTGEERLSFRRPGLQESVLRKLRREQFPTEAEIDLHGLTAAQAEAALRRFLGSALTRGLRCVRVVHGKGSRSGERGPVLKASVNALLKRSPAVLAFVSASPRRGGAGATSVLLRACD
jgi:DNA-nicking Smr family endonuclease